MGVVIGAVSSTAIASLFGILNGKGRNYSAGRCLFVKAAETGHKNNYGPLLSLPIPFPSTTPDRETLPPK